MEFDQKEWLGCWINFESYIYSEEPAMLKCWADAEGIAKMIPMLKNGVKSFWQMACDTVNEEKSVRLGGWPMEADGDGMQIEWIGENSENLGKLTCAPHRLHRWTELPV